MSYKDCVIVDLNCSVEKADKIVEYLDRHVQFYKVGLPLFLDAGTEIFQSMKRQRKTVLFDLNLNDVPSAAAKTAKRLVAMKVGYVTVSLYGGVKMIQAIRDTVGDSLQLIGTSVNPTFTNSSFREVHGTKLTIESHIEDLVGLYDDLIDGVICSPRDNKKLEKHNINIFNTGVRFKERDDEMRRFCTPKVAIDTGARFVIIGKEICDSITPFTVLKNIQQSLI